MSRDPRATGYGNREHPAYAAPDRVEDGHHRCERCRDLGWLIRPTVGEPLPCPACTPEARCA